MQHGELSLTAELPCEDDEDELEDIQVDESILKFVDDNNDSLLNAFKHVRKNLNLRKIVVWKVIKNIEY